MLNVLNIFFQIFPNYVTLNMIVYNSCAYMYIYAGFHIIIKKSYRVRICIYMRDFILLLKKLSTIHMTH